MYKRKFSPAVVRERLKQCIAANCRSDLPVRNKGMEILATHVGVYTNPATLEMDLWAYVDQIDSAPLVNDLYEWTRDLSMDHVIDTLPQSLPQFQLELV